VSKKKLTAPPPGKRKT